MVRGDWSSDICPLKHFFLIKLEFYSQRRWYLSLTVTLTPGFTLLDKKKIEFRRCVFLSDSEFYDLLRLVCLDWQGWRLGWKYTFSNHAPWWPTLMSENDENGFSSRPGGYLSMCKKIKIQPLTVSALICWHEGSVMVDATLITPKSPDFRGSNKIVSALVYFYV